MLAVPLNIAILRALAETPRRLADLRLEVGSPPQTTLRKRLRSLTEIGVLERQRQDAFPGVLDYSLGPAGRELLALADALEDWLAESPEGPIPLGGEAAKNAITALAEGWTTRMVRALAARPLSLTELDELISGVSYPSLERRLAAMRVVGLVEAVRGQGRGTPYGVTGWLRRAIAPLTVAVRWERLYLRDETTPLTSRDVEAAFLLAVPLVGLPPDLSGSCRLAMEIQHGDGASMAGVLVQAREGRIISCVSRLASDPDAWVLGSAAAWLITVAEARTGRLELGGDVHLAMGFLEGLHRALFETKAPPSGRLGLDGAGLVNR